MSDDHFPIYSDLAGDAEIGEIVLLYAEEMPDRAARLRAALDARNWEALYEASHQVKGSAGSHGFPTVSTAAAELNRLLREREPEADIVEAAEKLIGMCLRATGKPKQYCASGKKSDRDDQRESRC